MFCSLQAFSYVGGIERFNRRVIRTILDRAKKTRSRRPQIFLLNDQSSSLPVGDRKTIKAFGRKRHRFAIEAAIKSVLHAEVLLLDHINLLPLALLVRVLRPRLPILMFAHGIEVWNAPDYRRRRSYEPALLRAAVDSVVAVSEYSAGKLVNEFRYPRVRVRILPNAVDQLPSSRRRLNDQEARVLVVTRLASNERCKHVDKVIRAVAMLADEVPGLILEIVGNGPLLAELSRQAESLGVASRVRFHGRLDDGALTAAYERATVFALPSSKEGFGIVYLEAWLHDLPVIGGRGGAAGEVITHGKDGIIVDQENISEMADALSSLLKDKHLRDRYATEGKRKVMSQYLHEHFEARLISIISEFAVVRSPGS